MNSICWVDLGLFGLFLDPSSASTDNWQDHGLGLLRTVMHRDGVFTSIESVKNHKDVDSIVARLVAHDVLLMNVRTYNFSQARQIAERFKQARRNGIVIVGGMHATVNIDEMKAVQAFDHICVGPGEGIISELARNPGKHPRVFDGVAAASMDDWPDIDRRLWPQPLKSNHPFPLESAIPNWSPGPIASIITGAVCPWRCSFCNEASYIQNIKRKSVDAVIAELNHLDIEHGPIGSVVIHDSMFFQHPSWLKEWLEKYPKLARRKWPYWAAARADTVRKWPELFASLVLETNWNIVSIGLESGSDNTLLTLNKECTVQDNLYAIGMINQLGDEQQLAGATPVRLFSNVMFGVPGETREDVMDTMNMVSMSTRNIISPSLYAPYPGGALGYQLIAEGKSLLSHSNQDRNPNSAKAKDGNVPITVERCRVTAPLT